MLAPDLLNLQRCSSRRCQLMEYACWNLQKSWLHTLAQGHPTDHRIVQPRKYLKLHLIKFFCLGLSFQMLGQDWNWWFKFKFNKFGSAETKENLPKILQGFSVDFLMLRHIHMCCDPFQWHKTSLKFVVVIEPNFGYNLKTPIIKISNSNMEKSAKNLAVIFRFSYVRAYSQAFI